MGHTLKFGPGRAARRAMVVAQARHEVPGLAGRHDEHQAVPCLGRAKIVMLGSGLWASGCMAIYNYTPKSDVLAQKCDLRRFRKRCSALASQCRFTLKHRFNNHVSTYLF